MIDKKTWVSMTNQLVEMSKENEQLREENNNMHKELHKWIYVAKIIEIQNEENIREKCPFCEEELK